MIEMNALWMFGLDFSCHVLLVADLPMVFWSNVNFMDFGCNGLRNSVYLACLCLWKGIVFGFKLNGKFIQVLRWSFTVRGVICGATLMVAAQI